MFSFSSPLSAGQNPENGTAIPSDTEARNEDMRLDEDVRVGQGQTGGLPSSENSVARLSTTSDKREWLHLDDDILMENIAVKRRITEKIVFVKEPWQVERHKSVARKNTDLTEEIERYRKQVETLMAGTHRSEAFIRHQDDEIKRLNKRISGGEEYVKRLQHGITKQVDEINALAIERIRETDARSEHLINNLTTEANAKIRHINELFRNEMEKMKSERVRELAALRVHWEERMKACRARELATQVSQESPHNRPASRSSDINIPNDGIPNDGTPNEGSTNGKQPGRESWPERRKAFVAGLRKKFPEKTSGIPVFTPLEQGNDSTDDTQRQKTTFVVDAERNGETTGKGTDALIAELTTKVDSIVELLKGTPSESTRRRRGPKARNGSGVEALKESEPADTRKELLAICRKVFKAAFDVQGDEDFMAHGPIKPEVLEAHERGDTAPDPNNLRFDLKHDCKSSWNSAVLRILAERVKAAYKTQSPSSARPDAYFLDLVQEKYGRVRKAWRMAQAHVNDSGDEETQTDIETRLTVRRDAELKRARFRERRVANYERRMETVKTAIKCKREEGAADASMWEWVESLLKELTEEGMSSDDSSDDDDYIVKFRPRTLPWRRNIDTVLNVIDRQYRKLTRGNRGPKLAPRKRTASGEPSSRKPVRGLPICLYNQRWLAKQSEQDVDKLEPSEKEFEWQDLHVE
ncbi:hypothetical protein BD410DRAFT_841728 [Rickenella mellea]|uniref:Uncharacterized protein n=1 Tax=Rickenella mellea TaxID=50990 RepID=A0A4Y7PY12_9AGAM|nr:hypothetical protein BD410DRAFT_841728 [Rickenella mellea]